ncbi:hypothetical protein MWN33_13540 [Starkeya koreensis]|uniref:Uncharacterized protein n=1 Tax=Ancylobacter koreensis TaxID=266121 RepID=A0ABT0DP43_9HYPH|nr:hypothetical protein [Ancylobacter koreensis]MCK0209054.1 hypothetical protein [Ancylobacter koreensis]
MRDHHRNRRIRAMRSEEPAEAIAARAEALRPFLGRSGEERMRALRRLLRAERRAAGTGLGYDAIRHAALRRLLAEPGQPPAVSPTGDPSASARGAAGGRA